VITKLFRLAVFLWAASSSTAQTSDITPPRLLDFNISPTTIDTSIVSPTVVLTAHITDDLAGLISPGLGSVSATALFRSPHGGPSARILYANLSELVSGNGLDLICKGELVVPQLSHAGTWTLVALEILDNARNTARLAATDLQALGLPFSITVTGPEDITPPELVSLVLEPATVDISNSHQVITVTSRLRDDLSGLGGGFDAQGRPLPGNSTISFYSPSKAQSVTAQLQIEGTSGDERSGVFKGDIILPRYSEPGTWRLNSIFLIDAGRNVATIDLGSAVARGLPTDFTVTGPGDTTPPQFRALNFSPRRIDASTADQIVTVTARITDDLSGFVASESAFLFAGDVGGVFLSPSKKQSARVDFLPFQTGLFTSATFFPRFSETGVWRLTQFSARDVAGNTSVLYLSDLIYIGFES
jgi:hypothetical protein